VSSQGGWGVESRARYEITSYFDIYEGDTKETEARSDIYSIFFLPDV
jgi:hypothetical protein